MRDVKNGANLPPDTFDLDFSQGYERSRWNDLVLSKLCQELLNICEEEGGWGLPDVSEAYVRGMLRGHLKRSHDAWAAGRPRFSTANGRFETNDEAQQRAAEDGASRSTDIALRSRRADVSFINYHCFV